jgi:endonuclease-8
MNWRWRVGPVGSTGSGRPWLVLRGGAIEATQWNGPVLTLDPGPVRRLGPDLLADDTDPASLVRALRRADRARPLGETLQDQHLVAGIGNMWMSEALWAVRLSPWLPVGSASDDELLAALAWARAAMRASIAGARSPRAVYRRAGRPCGRCGTAIESRGQGDDNRTAYWCPACQVVA